MKGKAGIFLVCAAALLPAQPSLRGLGAVDGRVAWTGGTQGTVWRTSDGGAVWHPVSPPDSASLDFRDVEAISATMAFAMSAGPGGASRLYYTADAGTSWKLLAANAGRKGFWDAIAFWNPRRGLILGDPVDGVFDIRLTSDGGLTWKHPARPPAAREGEAAFAASGTCLTAGPGGRAWFVTGGTGGGRLFATRDWGQTWTASELPVAHGSAAAGAFSIAFDGTARGVVVGGNYQKAKEGESHVAYTSDGGATWQLSTGSRQYLSAVRHVRGPVWIATGPAGTEISRDGGRTWSADSEAGFHALSVARDGSIWASGGDGRAVRYRISARAAPRNR